MPNLLSMQNRSTDENEFMAICFFLDKKKSTQKLSEFSWAEANECNYDKIHIVRWNGIQYWDAYQC